MYVQIMPLESKRVANQKLNAGSRISDLAFQNLYIRLIEGTL